MRVGFLGTPKLASRYLDALVEEHEVVGVVTKPDRPRGRGREPQPPAVKATALAHNVPVLQPAEGECAEAIADLHSAEPDVCVVVAYGQIIPCEEPQLVEPIPFINVHYSLLPKLRGPAPVHHAILRGLDETGVTIQYIARELDAGDIIAQTTIAIEPDDTTHSLTVRLTDVGVGLLLEVLGPVAEGTNPRIPQDESEATYAPLLEKTDGVIDWSEPADVIERKVRAFNPWPSAHTTIKGKRTKILRADVGTTAGSGECDPGTITDIEPDSGFAVCCGEGQLWVRELQPAGKGSMSSEAFLRGARLEIGAQLG